MIERHGFSGNINENTDSTYSEKENIKRPICISGSSGGAGMSDEYKSYTMSAGESGGSHSDGPNEDNPIQIYHTWYYRKSDYDCVRQCSTWYTIESCSNIQQRFIISSKTVTFYWYYGTWNSRYTYAEDCIVKYNGYYYRCIQDHRGDAVHYPTETSYWEKRNFPDLSNWISLSGASATNGMPIPGDADYIEQVSISEGGLYYTDRDDTYEDMYIYYFFYYKYGGEYWYTWSRTGRVDFDNRLYTTPTVSYNNSTNTISVSSSKTGRFLMEFYRSGYNPTGYNERTRNEFFLTSLVGVNAWDEGDGGYYKLNSKTLSRWRKNKTYTVGIEYLDTRNRATLYSAINDVVWEINQTMSEFGIEFEKIATNSYANTTGDITFICGSHEELFGYEADYSSWYNGQWTTYEDDDGYIESATIKIRNDGQWHCTFKSCILEEMLQTLGAGRDQLDYLDNTVHSQFIYLNKPDYLTTVDSNILRIVYSSSLDAGMYSKEVATKINPTNGATIVTNGQKLSFLTPGYTYYAKIYVVNSYDDFSYPASITISVPSKTRPSNFSWIYPKTKGGSFNLTAAEWNDLTSRINAFRDYQFLTEYSFSTAYKDDPFTAAMYRQARTAIRALDGRESDDIPYVYSGDTITADMMNILVSELNSVP